MTSYQDEDDFDISNEDSIIDRIIFERNDIRVRVNTMSIIENLPITRAELPNRLLLRLPVRDNSVVPS